MAEPAADGMEESVRSAEDRLVDATFSGTDRKKSVTVTIDRKGMVQDVVVASDWSKRATPIMLGDAVLSAFDAARRCLVNDVVVAYQAAGLGEFAAGMRERNDPEAEGQSW